MSKRKYDDGPGTSTPPQATDHLLDQFLDAEWGPPGTMFKILLCVQRGVPVDVNELLLQGPLPPGPISAVAAYCFRSLIVLEHNGYIVLHKDPVNFKIREISLGPLFD